MKDQGENIHEFLKPCKGMVNSETRDLFERQGLCKKNYRFWDGKRLTRIGK